MCQLMYKSTNIFIFASFKFYRPLFFLNVIILLMKGETNHHHFFYCEKDAMSGFEPQGEASGRFCHYVTDCFT
jgi:hypothetical protein